MFTITYRESGQSSTTTVNTSTTAVLLTGLSPVTSYNVEIRGVDSKGRLGEVGNTMFTTTATG